MSGHPRAASLAWLELMWHSLMTEWDIPLHLNFTFQPTIDIDVAFKHLGRSRWKYYALQSRDFLCGRWGLVRERWCVLKGRKKDPFDTSDVLKEWHGDESIWWFVLTANRSRPYDIGLEIRRMGVASFGLDVGKWGIEWAGLLAPRYRAMMMIKCLMRKAKGFGHGRVQP